jgi:ribosomal protein L20A (L18A)
MAITKKFLVVGSFEAPNLSRKFNKIIEAENEKLAEHKVYSLIGSNYKCKRHKIKIDSIKMQEPEPEPLPWGPEPLPED